MKRCLLLPLLLGASLITAQGDQQNPETINNIVVFGDSYSDVGNKQRLTNGPLWSEDLAVGWNASLYSFAFSGSVCNNDMYPAQKGADYIPSITDQVEMFYNERLNLNSTETVFIYWVGVNDVYKIFENEDNADNLEAEYKKVIDCIGTNIRNVRRIFSANKFIVFGVPPIESMPFYRDSNVAASRERAANRLNELLTKEVEKMNKHLQLLELDIVDVHNLLDDIIENPEMFELKNAVDPYWEACQGKCSDDIDTYVWWDKTHLTGGIHRLFANSILLAGSLAPETYLEDATIVNKLLSEPNSRFKSPIYKSKKNTGEIDRIIAKMNEDKKFKDSDNLNNIGNEETKEESNQKTTDRLSSTFMFFGITGTVIVSIGFFLFFKSRRRRNHLSALSGLLKNKPDNRGRFVPLRNMDSEV